MSVLARYNDVAKPVYEPVVSTPMQDLMGLCDQVSVEAYAVGNLGDYFARKSSKLSHSMREAFSSFFQRDMKKPEIIQVTPLQRMLNTVDYTELMSLQIYQPVGLKGQFDKYAQQLSENSLPYMADLVKEVIIPAQKRFGYYVNNLSEIGQRGINEPSERYTLDALQTLISAHATWAQQGNHTGTAELGDIFESKQAVTNCGTTLNAINLERWSKAAPDFVKREVDKLVTITSTLLKALESQGDGASGDFTAMIAGQIRLVAQWVEWYSVMTVRITDATTAMKLNEGLIMKL